MRRGAKLAEEICPVYLKGEATRISIFMNVFDVHVNRYPVSGAIELVERHPGRFLHAAVRESLLLLGRR